MKKKILVKRKEAFLDALGARKNTQPNLNMTATKDIAEEDRCGDIKETAAIPASAAWTGRRMRCPPDDPPRRCCATPLTPSVRVATTSLPATPATSTGRLPLGRARVLPKQRGSGRGARRRGAGV